MNQSQTNYELNENQLKGGSVAFSEIEHIQDQSDLRFCLGLRSNKKFLTFGGEDENAMLASMRKKQSKKPGKLTGVARTQKEVKDMLREQKELRKAMHTEERVAMEWEDKLDQAREEIADLTEEHEIITEDLEDLKHDIKESANRQLRLKKLLARKTREFREKADMQNQTRKDMQKSMGMKNNGENMNMTAMGCPRRWWHPAPSASTAEPLVVYF